MFSPSLFSARARARARCVPAPVLSSLARTPRFTTSAILLPKTQRQVVLARPGPASSLRVRADGPVVRARGRGACIRVDAVAVAYRDVLDRSGAFPFIKGDAVLGHEIAGTVVEVGDEVKGIGIGDRVVSLHWAQNEAWPSPLTADGPVKSFLGLTTDGGYQEYVTVDESAFVRVPNAKFWRAYQAAPVMSTFGTVWMAAVERARLQKGERVLVTGASGGVGSAAIRLLKTFGCEVIAVTSNESKVDFLKVLGASSVIVGAEHFNKHPAVTEHGGVDMVIECTGEPTFSSSLRSLRPEGRLVLVGNTTNGIGKLPLGLVILNSLQVVGSDSISSKSLVKLFSFLDSHGLKPFIDEVLPLEEAAAAHEKLETKQVKGRIVLQVSDDDWGS